MLHKKLFLILLVFSITSLAQINIYNYMTTAIIDSIGQEHQIYSWYTGYPNLHLATNGKDIYLAAQKRYSLTGEDLSWMYVLYGKRNSFGNWQFDSVGSYLAPHSTAIWPSQIDLINGETPIIFYSEGNLDGRLTGGYIGYLKFIEQTDTGWVNKVLNYDYPPYGDPFKNYPHYVNEFYTYGFNMTNDESEQNGTTVYWERDVGDTVLASGTVLYKRVLSGQNWLGDTTFTVMDTHMKYFLDVSAVTKDGKYIAFTFYVQHPEHSYWGIQVLRRTENGYVKELADSTISDDGAYDYLNSYSLAIGEKPNGDVLLLASGKNRPMYLRTNGQWQKVTDNYPTGCGLGGNCASGRGLNNERIQFSSNGTAFWGDFDGFQAGFFSAEISFYTPDGHFGFFGFPPPKEFLNSGVDAYQFHDFVITNDDTLHFVYEFAPEIGHPKCLVEGKIYIPDLISAYTAVENNKMEPTTFKLFQNYPNPFGSATPSGNPTTTIKYSIPASETQNFASLTKMVTLKIYDVLGREIKTLVNEQQTPGNYSVKFNAANLPSGVYFYRLKAGNFVQTKKMVLLR
jgi:hypothetical protein